MKEVESSGLTMGEAGKPTKSFNAQARLSTLYCMYRQHGRGDKKGKRKRKNNVIYQPPLSQATLKYGGRVWV